MPVFLIVVLILLVMVVVIYSATRMSELKENAESGDSVEMVVVDGLPNIPGNAAVKINSQTNCLLIESKIGSETARLKYEQICNLDLLTESQIIKRIEERSVVKGAVAGGLLLGPLGAIVGGMTGLKSPKEKVQVQYSRYLVINYLTNENNEPKVVSFKEAGSTMGLDLFVNKLRSKAGLTSTPAKKEEHVTL